MASAASDVLNLRFSQDDHPYQNTHYRELSSASREIKFKDSCAVDENKDAEKILLVFKKNKIKNQESF